jgi:hypothetical protein
MLNWLADLVDVDRYEAPMVGPRVWWAGPLGVETPTDSTPKKTY